MRAPAWDRVRSVFQAALELPPEERGAWLRATCDDAALRAEVESLLEHAFLRGSFLEHPSSVEADVFEASEASRRIGSHIGPYAVIGLLGRGAMGLVYDAQQTSPRRRVALKVLRASPYLDELTPRLFQREVQALARMDHPGIAAIHEAGRSDEGWWYFAMEKIDGAPLNRYADEHGLSIDARLELFRRICDAVHYAHQRGVVHRDLKPSNILVTAAGEPKLLDFGLARIADADAGATLVTQPGSFRGTLAYASPEQARGQPDEIDARSDVYSLGVILYELLTGRLPCPIEGLTLLEAARVICEEPPPVAGSIRRELRGDLETILGKALEKDPRRRYASAAALAEDIERYSQRQPILARPPTTAYQLRLFYERHRLPTVLAGALLVIVVGSAIALGVLAFRVTEQRDDVLRLSALQDLEDRLREADALWPPHPQNIAAYRAWIGKAEALVGELPRHRAKREELRALALPRSAEQRLAERASHPDFSRLASLSGEIEAKRRALAQRRDGVSAPLPEVDWRAYPADASALNGIAWPLVDPERTSFGEEPLGLVLALRALELAGEDGELAARVGDTVAWAHASLGRDAEAAMASWAALEAAAEESKSEYADYLSRIESQADAARAPEGLLAAESELTRLESDLAAVESRVDARRDWRFPEEHGEARWWDAQLTKLIVDLEALQSRLLSSDAVTPEHGWSIPKRLAFACELESGSAVDAWERALPSIRAAYPGLELGLQTGLLPLGADPDSGLWEFAHLMTGAPAERGTDGKLVLTGETGVVLVLIPGGRFWMGAQSSDPNRQNYDPQTISDEGPVHEVELSAHFLSKYELTQGQWERLVGSNPSNYGPWRYATSWNSAGRGWSPLHPVENVSWLDCVTWLPRAGLALPSEAQWEHGCRGGTSSVYSSGDAKETLQGVANLADSHGRKNGQSSWREWEAWLDDGNSVHAVVGSFRANDLGLRDVHGNVWEWCLDGYDPDFYRRSPRKDPVAPWEGASHAVTRGGGFIHVAAEARSANRERATPPYADNNLGVRPARVIER